MDIAAIREVFKYTDYAKGSVTHRNNSVDYIQLYTSSLKESIGKEVYCGMFQFDETFNTYLEETGSVSGFKGNHFAYFFPVDIDTPYGDIEEARAKTISFIDYLATLGVTDRDVYIYFSGAKGFHILIPHVVFGYPPSKGLCRVFKKMAGILAKSSGIGLLDKDTSGLDMIYDQTRLFRLPNTQHGKSGMYKVQLTLEELKTLELSEIFTIAEQPRELLYKPKVSVALPRVRDLYMKAQSGIAMEGASVIPAQSMRGNSSEHTIKNAKVCIARLLNGVGAGQRDDVAVRLADHFRKQGLSQELTTTTLLGWNQRNDPPLSTRDIEVKVNSAWSNEMDYGCHDHILAAHCSSTCYLYKLLVKNKDTESPMEVTSSLKTREDLVKALIDRHFDGPGIVFGIPTLDRHLKLHGGHVVQYMAKSGSGKTAFAMYLMNMLSKQNTPSLFLSLEMSDADVAERSFQMGADKTSVYLERLISDCAKRGTPREQIADLVLTRMGDAFSSVVTVDEDSATIESIENYIYKAKEVYNTKIVFLDYLGRVSQTNGANSYEHVSRLAKELKSLAKRHDVIIFLLHQVNRSIEDASSAIEMGAGRDSGQTEEASDVLLASWRPGVAEGINTFIIRILKNRRGAANIDVHLEFIPETMQFKELDNNGFESRL
jgi:KaiC/GvpD/RAD55 family RecA-like ATPase